MVVFKENFLEEEFEIGQNHTPVTVMGGIDDKSKTFIKSKLALVPYTGMTHLLQFVKSHICYVISNYNMIT